MDFAKQYKWVLVILFALVLLGVYVHFHNKNKLKKERAPGKQPAAKKTSQVTTNVANPPVTDSHRENPAQNDNAGNFPYLENPAYKLQQQMNQWQQAQTDDTAHANLQQQEAANILNLPQ